MKYILLSLLFLCSCKSREAHKIIAIDSVKSSVKKEQWRSGPDARDKKQEGIVIMSGAMITDAPPMEIYSSEYYDILVRNETGTIAYKQKGKWVISNPEAALEQMYQSWKTSDSLRILPAVIINHNNSDTFRVYYPDTIHINGKTAFDYLSYPSPSPIPDSIIKPSYRYFLRMDNPQRYYQALDSVNIISGLIGKAMLYEDALYWLNARVRNLSILYNESRVDSVLVTNKINK